MPFPYGIGNLVLGYADPISNGIPAVSSNQSLDGKIFIEFVALIYLSYIKKKMQDKNLFKKYTMQELLDELDIIECFEQTGRALQVGEVTKQQAEFYEAMEVALPTSL